MAIFSGHLRSALLASTFITPVALAGLATTDQAHAQAANLNLNEVIGVCNGAQQQIRLPDNTNVTITITNVSGVAGDVRLLDSGFVANTFSVLGPGGNTSTFQTLQDGESVVAQGTTENTQNNSAVLFVICRASNASSNGGGAGGGADAAEDEANTINFLVGRYMESAVNLSGNYGFPGPQDFNGPAGPVGPGAGDDFRSGTTEIEDGDGGPGQPEQPGQPAIQGLPGEPGRQGRPNPNQEQDEQQRAEAARNQCTVLENQIAAIQAEINNLRAEAAPLIAERAEADQAAAEAQQREQDALENWRDADRKQVDAKNRLQELKDERDEVNGQIEDLEQQFAEKIKERQDAFKQLEDLKRAIEDLNNIATGLHDKSDQLADKAKTDAYNAAVQAATSLATAGFDKALDKAAGDITDRFAKDLAAKGQKLTKDEKADLLKGVRKTLEDKVGEQGKEQIGEIGGNLAAEGGTADDLTIDLPIVGEVGVGDLGSGAVDAAVNVGGAFGNLLAAIGVGSEAERAAEAAVELNRSLGNLTGILENQHAALGEELQNLNQSIFQAEAERDRLNKQIPEQERAVEEALNEQDRLGNALLDARNNARQAQQNAEAVGARVGPELERINGAIAERNQRLTTLRAQLQQCLDSASLNGNSLYSRRVAAVQSPGSPLGSTRAGTPIVAFSGGAIGTTGGNRTGAKSIPSGTLVNPSTFPSLSIRQNGLGGNERLSGWVNANASISRSNLGSGNGNSVAKNFGASAGLSYQLDRNVQVGGGVRYAHSDSESSGIGTDTTSNLFGGSAYARFTLPGDLSLMLAGAYEYAPNDVVVNGNSGSFDQHSVIFNAGLSKQIVIADQWWVAPNVGVSWIRTQRDGYTNSAGTAVPGGTDSFGTISFAPTVGKIFDLGKDGHLQALTPTFGVSGTQHFGRNGDRALNNGANLTESDRGLTLQVNLNTRFANGLGTDIGGSYSIQSDDSTSWSLSGGLSSPLNAFTETALGFNSTPIFGSESTISFTMSGTPDANLTARTRIRIPLN